MCGVLSLTLAFVIQIKAVSNLKGIDFLDHDLQTDNKPGFSMNDIQFLTCVVRLLI